jgi:hypothetical protein
MRGRQQRAWTWPRGFNRDGRRAGVRSVASLPKRRETGEDGGGPVWGGVGAKGRSRGSGRPAMAGRGGGGCRSGGVHLEEREGARGPA